MLQIIIICYIIISYVILIEWRVIRMEMQMDMSYVFAVVITGLVVVFIGLILLILFITAIGKIFEASSQKKKSKETVAVRSEPVKAAVQETVADDEPEEQTENDDEVIAVIAAAVAMMSEADGKTYRISSVRPARKVQSGNAWAMAGIRENTNPF